MTKARTAKALGPEKMYAVVDRYGVVLMCVSRRGDASAWRRGTERIEEYVRSDLAAPATKRKGKRERGR